MVSAYRYAVTGVLLLAALEFLAVTPVNGEASDDPDDIAVEIVGIIEGQKLTYGQKVPLRGAAANAEGDWLANVNYSWYAGTTLIGQTQDIVWKVKGPSNTQVKLLVEDRDGRKAEKIVNVTIRRESPPPSDPSMDPCVAVIIVVPIIAVALAFTLNALFSPDPGPRYSPPHR